ncbi:MAG: ral nucleoside transport system ATP-binding protein [Halanaerobiales bacterium]|nr:ral nucleoside transport system ATP-binding protein [Halanaerobiales bacterium]
MVNAKLNRPDIELIKISSLVKIYPPATLAVDQVDLTIKEGEIHSIIGENGAGKSTLMKALYGLIPYNSGKIYLRGKEINFGSPKEAVRAGIGMVHQEFMLIPSYTVLENVILGVEPTGYFGVLNKRKARERVEKLVEEYNLNLNLNARIEDISVAARQKVEILKLLYKDVDILILDEPTAVLTPQEIEELFSRLKRLKAMEKTIIFISHKLDEVLELSDTITVMRKGKKVTTMVNENLTKSELARAMVGREVVFTVKKDEARPGDEVLRINNLTYTDRYKQERLKGINFNIRKGEIVGLAGVEGNGQFELVNCIMGLIDDYQGEILINGVRIDNLSILERRKLMAYLPQDRKDTGSAQDLSLISNSIMTHHRINPGLTGRWEALLDPGASRELTGQIIDKFNVLIPGIDAPISSLSGGNQQKVIVGREFMLNTDFVLLDQPTRGLDVGSIEFIQKEIIRKRDSGVGILLISADLDELFNLSDRLLIIYQGRIVAEVDPAEVDKEEVGEYMLGAKGVAS